MDHRKQRSTVIFDSRKVTTTQVMRKPAACSGGINLESKDEIEKTFYKLGVIASKAPPEKVKKVCRESHCGKRSSCESLVDKRKRGRF